jgi:hypothetical protein
MMKAAAIAASGICVGMLYGTPPADAWTKEGIAACMDQAAAAAERAAKAAEKPASGTEGRRG